MKSVSENGKHEDENEKKKKMKVKTGKVKTGSNLLLNEYLMFHQWYKIFTVAWASYGNDLISDMKI